MGYPPPQPGLTVITETEGVSVMSLWQNLLESLLEKLLLQ